MIRRGFQCFDRSVQVDKFAQPQRGSIAILCLADPLDNRESLPQRLLPIDGRVLA